MEFWTDIITSPPVVIAALIIGTLGEVTKRIVLGSDKTRRQASRSQGPYRTPKARKVSEKSALWRRIYYVTLPAHPVIAGCLLGLIPWLPSASPLEKEGFEFASRLGTYALAGVLCKVGYDTMVATIRRFIVQRAGVDDAGGSSESASISPEDPASEADEAVKS